MTDARDNIIVLEDVTKRFGDVTAADRVSLGVRRGEFVTLLGPSGCGKTTLLRMIAGFEPPTSGRIFIGGRDMEGVPPARRPVNTVFQKYALFPHLTVFGNVAFGLKLLRVPAGKDARGRDKTRRLRAAEIKEKTERSLRVVGLEGMGGRAVGTLSGGQQQRVAIARAAVLQPEVLLLDEPLGALDLTMRLEMRHELKRMQRELGITFVYVTHDQEEALAMSDTVVVMSAGAVHQTGTPEDVYFRPADAFVAGFVGGGNLLRGVSAHGGVECLGAVLPCDGAPEPGRPTDVVIRPEHVRLTGENDPEAFARGAVISSSFAGSRYEVRVAAGGEELTAYCPAGYAPGSIVGICADRGSVIVL